MTAPATSPTADSQAAVLSPDAIVPTGSKRQPWREVWPAPREPQPQAQIYGFEKGEVMVFDGNAGNFFARDGWTVEQESDSHKARLLQGAQNRA